MSNGLPWNNDEELVAYFEDKFAELDPVKAEQAIVWLSGELTEAKADILKEIEEHGSYLWNFDHFGWGMSVRNHLRTGGFGEEFFGIDNLDDYYVSLVERAVHYNG